MVRILGTLLFVAALANGQNVSCLLSGTVRDPSGAVVPGAEVRLTAAATGFTRTTKTNAEGFFSFPDLTPGQFTVHVTAAGFKGYSRAGIEIRSGEQRSLGVIPMEVGAATETVTVTAEAAPISLASGEKAGVLTSEDLSNVAIKGRDFMDAIALLPGVVDLNETRESPSSSTMNDVYIIGARDSVKSMTVDGVTNVDIGDNRALTTMPSMDSVAELKVLMSNYSAEYGRNSGGTITVITKGGGKDFHATGGWYHRHEQFSANDYFNNRNGVPRPRYRYNIFSYTVGGPIYLPGKFNSDRSKLFFFFSQEYQRQLVTVASKTVTVPTALERAGDFSQSKDVNGSLIRVYDALNNQTQFPGNIIPASRFSRVGQNVLKLFPLPNFVDPAPSRLYQWNYISSPDYPWPRRTEIFRADYSPRQNVQLYVRLSHNADMSQPTWGAWMSGSVNFPLTRMVLTQPGRAATVHAAMTISPSLFNEFVAGFSQNKIRYYPVSDISRRATGIDIPQLYPGNNPANLIPDMSFSGVSNAANPSLEVRVPGYTYSTTYSIVDNLSKIYGTHTFKFGLYAERALKDQNSKGPIRGQVAFGRDRANPLDTNHPYANALTGVYASYTEATAQFQAHLRFRNVEWYAQDDWRVRPGLFLNYGVRFYNDPPTYDALLQASTFIPERFDPAKAPTLLRPAYDAKRQKIALDPLTGTAYPAIMVGTFVPGRGDAANGMVVAGQDGVPKALMSMPAVTVAPRFGFAWDPFGRGRTSVRGGIGVFYNRNMLSTILNEVGNPPTAYTSTIYYGTLESLGQGQGLLAPSSIYALYGDQKPETAYNFSLGVQQRVGRYASLDVSYVGSAGRNMIRYRNVNPVPIGARFVDQHPENRDPTTTSSALPVNFLRPYAGWGDINMWEWKSWSDYNSLQVSAAHRVPRGLVALGYTFSKVLGDNYSDWNGVSPFFDPRARNYGVLRYDRTHVLTLRYNYMLPRPGRYFKQRWLGVVADHWEISGVTKFISGAPFTPGLSTVDGQDITGTPSESARPDVIDPAADPVSRFGRPARGTFGNVGSNVLRGPGVNNWDISVYRRIPIREGGKCIQLRFESYNTFNHTQFSSMSTSARFDVQGRQVDPLFLTPTAARSPRRVQLAMRFNW